MNPTIKRKEIASEILGEILWTDDTFGYCRCPGIEHHTSKNHKQDCRIYVDQVPTVKCFHDSCEDEIIKANRELRSAVGKAEAPLNLKTGKIPRAPIDPKKEALIQKAHYLRQRLQVDYGWSLAEIIAASNPPEHPVAQARELFMMFQVFDVVWNGHLFESGKLHHGHRFKSLVEWVELCDLQDPGHYSPAEFTPDLREFVAPSSFKGGYVRGKENIAERRFLVVESDTLSKDEVGAVFKWLGTRLRLRSIIDTGNKSLHGWFEYPDDELLKELFVILPILGCDRKMFNPAQACRMPGVIRQSTGKLQEMIYLNGGGK